MPDLDALLSEADRFVATRGEPRRDTDLVKRLAAALRSKLAEVRAVLDGREADRQSDFEAAVWEALAILDGEETGRPVGEAPDGAA